MPLISLAGLRNRLNNTSQNQSKPSQAVQSDAAAVLIGIEYVAYARQGRAERLPGCHRDISKAKQFLIEQFGFNRAHMKILADNGGGATIENPTHGNIRKSLQWLNAKGRAGCKTLVLYYSGHGTQTADHGGDEVDGRDEAIVPADYASRGLIVDDTIAHDLLQGLPADCSVFAVFDSCNSGTVLDLPLIWRGGETTQRAARKDHFNIEATVVSLSGCKDPQTSASAFNLERKREWRGALSFCLETVLRRSGWRGISCVRVAEAIRHEIATRGFVQVPELCFSKDAPTPPHHQVFIR